jgi:hypothetical protein
MREREPPTHTRGWNSCFKNLKISKMGTTLNTFQNNNNNNKILSFSLSLSFSPPQTLEGLAMDLRMWVLWS